MTQTDNLNLERRIIKLEEHCPFNSPEKIAAITEGIKTNLESIRIDIKKNQDDIRKILLLNRSLVDQSKSQGEIIKMLQSSLHEMKNLKIIDPTSNAEMDISFSNFSKYILERINPDKQVRRWVVRLKDWGVIIIVIILILMLLFGTKFPGIFDFMNLIQM